MRRYLIVSLFAVQAVCAACSDEPSGPQMVDLQGTWRLGYVVSDSAFTCTFHDVTLLFDSLSANPALMTGGTGVCVGRGRNDTTFQGSSAFNSLTMTNGRIHFIVFGGWEFDGRIRSADSLDGTTTQDWNYVGIGALHMIGPWGAHRRPPGP